MSKQAARSIFGEITVIRSQDPDTTAPHAGTTVFIDADEPVFDGHYPGFPILPGVCLIECAHRSALATMPGPAGVKRARLVAVESARFLAPVYPGEMVGFELTWKRVDAGWQCRITAHNPRGESARIRLRYAVKDA